MKQTLNEIMIRTVNLQIQEAKNPFMKIGIINFFDTFIQERLKHNPFLPVIAKLYLDISKTPEIKEFISKHNNNYDLLSNHDKSKLVEMGFDPSNIEYII